MRLRALYVRVDRKTEGCGDLPSFSGQLLDLDARATRVFAERRAGCGDHDFLRHGGARALFAAGDGRTRGASEPVMRSRWGRVGKADRAERSDRTASNTGNLADAARIRLAGQARAQGALRGRVASAGACAGHPISDRLTLEYVWTDRVDDLVVCRRGNGPKGSDFHRPTDCEHASLHPG